MAALSEQSGAAFAFWDKMIQKTVTSIKVVAIHGLLILLLFAMGAAQTAQQIFRRASEALKRGDYAAAETDFRNVIKLEPRNVNAMGNLGVVYARTLRFARAICWQLAWFMAASRPPRLRY